MASNYTPKPIDISDQKLPEELLELTERIAENAHDFWALGRIREGWTHGPTRDDSLKTHPDLVPYDELPEGEKEYDRTTAMSTLKLIQKLGYEIRKKAE
ncbi:MAG: hypothetical protein IKP04_05235 [Candidatus Methanomethylophilaceae archaeon]|nr:hypothetical protein [Candidatus Methanomethylophilaceae archaeon]